MSLRLVIANPFPVDDGHGDISIGFVPLPHVEVVLGELVDDIHTIIEAYAARGYDISPSHSYYAWGEYSASLQAHWLYLIDPFENTKKFMLVDRTGQVPQ